VAGRSQTAHTRSTARPARCREPLGGDGRAERDPDGWQLIIRFIIFHADPIRKYIGIEFFITPFYLCEGY
jgi:hypothetical protein